MSNKRRFAIILISLLVLICAFGMFSCNRNKECEHEWETKVIKEATCQEEGVQEKSCTKCTEVIKTAIGIVSHKYGSWVNEVVGNCQTPGTKAHYQCEMCKKYFDEGKVEISDVSLAGDHNWQDATCEAPRTCSVCKTTEGEAKAHTEKTPATCTSKAVCSVCNKEYGDYAEHVFDKEVVDSKYLEKEATCEVLATYYKSCACGEKGKTTFTDGVLSQHSYVNEVVDSKYLKNEATCSSPAIYNKSCACGAKGEATFTNGEALAHSYVNEIVDTKYLKDKATCDNPATYYKSCDCGARGTKNDIFTAGAAKGHNYKPLSTKQATCTSPSLVTYYCDGCGDDYEEPVGDVAPHNVLNVTPIETKVEGTTCEYVLSYQCPDCPAIVTGESVFHHNYVARITAEATCKEEGVKTLTCSCGASTTAVIEKDEVTGHDWESTTVENVRTDTCKLCGATKVVEIYTGTSTNATNAGDLKNKDVEVNNANISLGSGVVDQIGEDKQITISAEKYEDTDREGLGLTQDQLDQIGNSPVYNFTINDGTENISNFGEDNYVTVTLPYTLGGNEDVDSIAIWYISDDGELKSYKATYNNGYVSFKTNHFSYYTVTILTPEERCALYGHNNTYKTVEGTCTEDSYELTLCIRCRKTEKKITQEAPGHSYVQEQHDATCTENGYVINKCSVCDHTYRTRINAQGHSWKEEDTKAATCQETGYTKYGCENCDKEYSEVYPKVAHELKETKVFATCEQQGYTLRECENCDFESTSNIVPALGHDYSAGWSWSADNSTATVVFSCSRDTSHDVTVNARVSVEVINGECSSFKKTTYTAKTVFNGVEYSDIKVIEDGTPSHVFSTELSFDKDNHYYVCVCGAKSEVTPHEFGLAEQTKAPTCGENGEKTAYCDCGASNVTEIPKLGKHSFEEGICSVCGAEDVNSFYVSFVNSWKSVEGFAIKLENLSFEMFEDNTSIGKELSLIGDIKQLDIAELVLYIEEGELKGAVKGSISMYNGPFKDSRGIYSFEAVIEDGFVYAKLAQGKEVANQYSYYMVSVDEAIEMLASDMGDFSADGMSMAIGMMANTIIPMIDSVIECNKESVEEIFESIFNMIFTFELQEDGTYIATLDYYKLYLLNENLATKPISEVIEIYFGEGAVAKWADGIKKLFDLKLSEIPGFIESQGIDLDDLIDQINIYGQRIMPGFDFEDYLYEETLQNIAIGELISGDENYSATIDGMVSHLREYKLYDLFEGGETIKQEIDSVIDMLSGAISISLTTSADGTLTGIDLGCNGLRADTDYNEYFKLSFDFSMIVNGRADVSWLDVVDTVKEKVILPPEEKLEEQEIRQRTNGIMGSILYKDTYYSMHGDTYYFDRVNFERLFAVEAYEDCQGWMEYRTCYVIETAAYGIYDLYNGNNEFVCTILENQQTYEKVEYFEGDEEIVLTYDDGSTKKVSLEGLTMMRLFEEAFGELDWSVDGSYDVEYYYNKETNEYGEESYHQLKTEYEVLSLSCDDGYIRKTFCENCNYYTEDLNYNCRYEAYELDLSTIGACNGILEGMKCYRCGALDDDFRLDSDCEFTTTEQDICDSNGNVIGTEEVSVCVNCGLTGVYKYYVEQDSTCSYIEVTQTLIYFGEELIGFSTESERTVEHNFEYNYELKGDSCLNGCNVMAKCLDCGISYTTNYREHYTRILKETYDLSEYGMCGGYINKYECVCGEKQSYDVSSDCNLEGIDYNDHYTDTNGVVHVISRESCDICGLIVEYDNYIRADGCYRYNACDVSLIMSGETVIEYYEESYGGSNHQYERTYEFVGDIDCEDGVTIYYECTQCGYEYDNSYNYHQAILTEKYNLDEYGACGGYVYLYSCPCGEQQKVEENIYNCYLQEEESDYTDRDGIYHTVTTGTCEYCGLVVIRDCYDKIDGCYAYSICTLSLSIDGETLIDEYTYAQETISRHCYEYEYELNNDASCWYGGKLYYECRVCGDKGEEYFQDHRKLIHAYELGEYGICGDAYAIHTCPCGYYGYHEYLFSSCEMEETTDTYVDTLGNEIVVKTMRCNSCGLEITKAFYEKEENCYKYKLCDISIYVGDTVVEDDLTIRYGSTSEEHNYEYTYTFDGDSCEDGINVYCECSACGKNYEYYSNGHEGYCNRVYVDLSEKGACGGYVECYECACGEKKYFEYNIECDYTYDYDYYVDENDIEHYIEKYECECGLVVEKDRYSQKIGCMYYELCLVSVSVDGTSILDEYLYVEWSTENHDYQDIYELVGDSCEDGVDAFRECKDCGEGYHYNTYYYHDKVIAKEFYDFSMHGACGGYIGRFECVCGQESGIEYSMCGDYDYSENEYDDSEGRHIYVETYTCWSCDLRVTRTYYITKEDGSCIETKHYTLIANVGEEAIAQMEYEESELIHDYDESYSFIDSESTSCEDGLYVTYTCKVCGDVSYDTRYGHEVIEVERISLEEYGNLCGGYFVKYECFCGAEKLASIEDIIYNFDCQPSNTIYEGAITEGQYSINNFDYIWDVQYDDYIYVCPITDPQCVFSYRRICYYKLEEDECSLTQYVTYLFGYDRETGEYDYEYTYATGGKMDYHHYECKENVDEELGLYEYEYTCALCGSYYYSKTQSSDGYSYEHKKAENKLDNGNLAYKETIFEYVNGVCVREYYKQIDFYDNEYWTDTRKEILPFEAEFGTNGYIIKESETSSEGYNKVTERAYTIYEGYEFVIYQYEQNGERWQRISYTYSFDPICQVTVSYEDNDGETYSYDESCHHGYWEITKYPTCTQYGYEMYTCAICSNHINGQEIDPTGHNWYSDGNGYYCFACGLENANGADGDVIFEDLTAVAGDEENYVIGYYNSSNVYFDYYVYLVLHETVEGQDNEIYIEAECYMTSDRYVAICIDKSSVEALGQELGYTRDMYDVKLVFVPEGADLNLDFAIIITE